VNRDFSPTHREEPPPQPPPLISALTAPLFNSSTETVPEEDPVEQNDPVTGVENTSEDEARQVSLTL